MVFAWIFHQPQNYSVYLGQNDNAQGRWIGTACEAFGVKQGTAVRHAEFTCLEDNLHAVTGERLTRRKNGMRKEPCVTDGRLTERIVSDRRTVFDFSISAPKSFSVALLVGQRADILLMHQVAVAKVAKEMEKTAMCAHSHGNVRSLETTENFCAAQFTHFSTRSGDPGLHTHLAIPNATVSSDGKIYALDAAQWLNRCSFFTNVYRDSLASQALQAGLELTTDKYGAPQLKKIEDLNVKFSARSVDIEAMVETAEEIVGSKLTDSERKRLVLGCRGIDLPNFREIWNSSKDSLTLEYVNDPNAVKARRRFLGAFEAIVRSCSDQSAPEVIDLDDRRWREALDPEELGRLLSVAEEKAIEPPRCVTIEDAVNWSIKHSFERESVVASWRLETQALRYAQGANLDLDKLRECIQNHKSLIHRGDQATTLEHYSRECDTIKWVELGKGKGAKLGKIKNQKLTDHQLKAVNELLGCQDQFFCLLGKAGTGKSASCDELIKANESQGYRVMAVAPSTKARDVLTNKNKATLQLFLTDPTLQSELRPMDLLVVDEAGFASTSMFHKLMDLAIKNRWRVCFSGDEKQHHSVEAGDALRVILSRTNIRREWLSNILRQLPNSLDGRYLRAAKQFSVGKITEAFATLDRAGAIYVSLGQDRVEKMADSYMTARKEGRSVVVVNPSHQQCDLVNSAIRERLKNSGIIGKDISIQAHRTLGLTLAEREECRNLKPGQLIEITLGSRKGETLEIRQVDQIKNVVYAVNNKGVRMKFDKSNAEAWNVCERREFKVAIGDDLVTHAAMVTKRGKVQNGEMFTVSSVNPDGSIVTTSGKCVETKNLSYAYAGTSHASQGQTAQVCLVGFSRNELTWATQKVAYVACTRGVSDIRIFVESKEGLVSVEKRKGDRKSAVLDLIKFCIDQYTRRGHSNSKKLAQQI